MKKSPVLSSTPPYDADGSAKQCPPLKDTNANSDDSNNNSFYSVFQRGNKRASVKNIRDAFESAAAAASAKNNDHNKLSRQSNGVVTPLRKPSKIPAPQDRLLQSQTYIERLQRNLATRLSTATVEAFRRDYSPVRSVRTDDLKNNNEGELREKGNCDSGEKVVNNDTDVSKRGEGKELSSQEPENSQSRECEENSVEHSVRDSDHVCKNRVPAEHNQSGLKVERSRKSDFERRSGQFDIKENRQSSKPEENRQSCEPGECVSIESEESKCKRECNYKSQNCEIEEGSQNCDLERNIGQFEPERKIQNCEPEENSWNCEVDQSTQKCTLEECNQICDIEQDDKIKEDRNSEAKIDYQTCESEITSSKSELPENVEHTDPKETCVCNCPERGNTGDDRPRPSGTESVHLDASKNDAVKQPCSVETTLEVKEEEPEQDNQLIIHSAARARKLEFLNGPKVASSPVAGQSEGKQQRVSWTTRLIQKLTEEEENAKKRVVKVVRPKRIVRFPQKKTAKELEKSKWKPVPPPRSSSVPPTPTATDESGEQKESKSGVKIDGDTKDAYASLISQLVQINKTKKQGEIKPQSEDKLKKEDTPAQDREDSWLSSTSEDDDQDSVIAAPGVVRQSNPEPSSVQTGSPMKKDGETGTGVGARSSKNTGIRRLLPTGLFSGSHNKNEPSSVTERLLKPTTMPAGHRVYPQQRPIVETAFLSSPTEPEKQRTRRSQSSSPATRHNTRKVQEVSNKEQTDSVSQRSKSVSPSRRSSSSKRTIPETSLILEERLNHIRRELWQTQQQQPRRPASTTPVETGRHRQPQNSLPSSPRSRTSKSNSSDGGRGHYAVVRPPADAYFHSPPSRRRAQQQSMSHPNDQGAVLSVPQQRKTSSSASSTSTIVPEEAPHPPSNTSWNPLLQQTISGSPDIRLLQQQYRPQGGPYAVVRTQHRSPEGLLQPVQNSVYNSPVPSGRLSAPPVPPSHYGQHIDVSSRRRMMSPEPAVSYARRSVPHFSPPLSATIQVPSPSTSSSQSSPRQQDPVNTTSAQTQTTKSFIQQQQQQHHQQQQQQQMMDMSPKSSSSAGSTPGHRLSRQEVEALYWETQRLRAGLSDLSRHLARPQYAPVVKPQPVYNTRARSLSPLRQQVLSPPSSRSMSLPRDTYFTRGTPQRNTIGPIRTSSSSQQHSPLRQQNNNTPTIYEDPQEEMNGTVQLRNHDDKQSPNSKSKSSQYPLPIFKRGSLYSSTSTTSVDSNVSQTFPKRVSFGSFPSDYYQSWPTRNGPASQPPTRQSRPDSIDSDVFLPEGYGTYANLPGVVSPPPRSSSQHQQAPNRPLPPVPRGESPGYGVVLRSPHARWQQQSDTESGSEAGEVQRILQQGSQHRHSNGATYFRFPPEEEWGADGKGRGPPGTDQSASSSSVGRDDGVRRGGGRSGRRDEPRRHTLSGDHHHAQAQQGGVLARSMDLESPLPRGYPPPSSAMLFDDDPGIMSEVETSSTGFRRGGKQRSSLPVVRTPSKTLERPLGLVFLQYRNETKRALLPNEITSIDTVKALFVRSFPKQLTMEYLDSPHVKIYIHDSSKDMFYELEDLRSHLRDIRDRSVLRLFESTDMNGGVLPGAGVGVVAPPMWDQDQSYFSEPEFDSEYQHQHIHKTKASKSGSSVPPQAPYYMTHSYPPGGGPGASATLPRGGPLLRAYSPAVAPPVPAERMKSLPQSADRLHAESGYMSSPERGGPRAYPAAYPPGGPGYEDPYYSQYTSRSGSITPVIDEEARIRVEHMERQLANLTGLVQKALTQTPTAPREYLQVPPASSRDATYRNDKSVSFEKSVSFSDEPPDMNSPKQHSPQHTERTERERHKPAPPPKPVSLSPGQYEGRHVYRDLQLTPEMYNQLRGLQKKAKDLRQEVRNLRRMSQAQAHSVRETIRDTFIKIRAMLLMGGEESWAIAGDAEKIRLNREEDSYKQEMLRLEKDLTELESTVEELRGNVINRKTRVNMSDVENMALILSKSSKTVADLKVRFPSLQEGMKGLLASEMEKVVREEKFLKEEPERLESALRRCKKLTGTLVTLKRLASVQEQRLPPSAGGDARLSPTLGLGGDSDTPITPPAHGKPGAVPARSVMAPTIGGDASSRQRPENALDALLDELQTFARPPSRGSSTHNPPMADIGRKGSIDSHPLPSAPGGTTSLRRLHSYPSSSDGGGNSPPTVALSRLQADAKPPVPERNSELLSHLAGRRVPPPPPPRTSSRSPLASPTSPSLPPRGTVPPSQPQMGIGSGTLLRRGAPGRSSLREPLRGNISIAKQPEGEQSQQQQQGFNPASNSSSCESINSQEGMQNKSTTTSTTGTTTTTSTGNKARQEILEQRHQELLRKQRALQEQYARLQQLQRSGGGGLAVVPPPDLLLKKTGSESNLLAKMGLGHGLSAAAPMSGSLTHLAAVAASGQQQAPLSIAKPLTISVTQPSVTVTATAATSTTSTTTTATTTTSATTTTTNKIYETDIL